LATSCKHHDCSLAWSSRLELGGHGQGICSYPHAHADAYINGYTAYSHLDGHQHSDADDYSNGHFDSHPHVDADKSLYPCTVTDQYFSGTIFSYRYASADDFCSGIQLPHILTRRIQ
jgi:hypothetical protein